MAAAPEQERSRTNVVGSKAPPAWPGQAPPRLACGGQRGATEGHEMQR